MKLPKYDPKAIQVEDNRGRATAWEHIKGVLMPLISDGFSWPPSEQAEAEANRKKWNAPNKGPKPERASQKDVRMMEGVSRALEAQTREMIQREMHAEFVMLKGRTPKPGELETFVQEREKAAAQFDSIMAGR